MPHVLVAGKIHRSGLDLLEAADGVTWEMVEDPDPHAYTARLGDADGLVIRTQPLTEAILAQAPRLTVVARHGVGYDAVDVAALSGRGIPLAIVGDVNSISVAEHAMTLILAAAKRLGAADRAVRAGPWGWRDGLEPREISGKRLLILGYGRIGRHLARMASGFEMEIRAYDPYLAERGWPGGPATPAPDLAQALGWADIVSVNVPGTGAPLLGRAEIAATKPGALIVNTARGGVVDEAALAEALAEGRIAGAGLDVFAAEPPPPDDPLLRSGATILTPHVAGLTREAAERMAVSAVRNVLDHFAGRIDSDLVVNRDALAG